MKKLLLRGGLALAAFLVLAQFVPYGRDHANPASVREPAWDSPATRALARDACFDCHSNLTTWPVYSRIAPGSWLIYNDVKGGREHLDFSEWNRPQEVEDLVSVVRSGEMPPWYYRLLHPKSRLSAKQKDELASGLEKTVAQSPPGR